MSKKDFNFKEALNAIQNATKKWTMLIRNWKLVLI